MTLRIQLQSLAKRISTAAAAAQPKRQQNSHKLSTLMCPGFTCSRGGVDENYFFVTGQLGCEWNRDCLQLRKWPAVWGEYCKCNLWWIINFPKLLSKLQTTNKKEFPGRDSIPKYSTGINQVELNKNHLWLSSEAPRKPLLCVTSDRWRRFRIMNLLWIV